LHLLTVLIKNPNFLLLDEPTNDLDLFALNRLEEFLLGYKGCLVIVSHDRYFLDKLSDHIFVFEGDGKIKDHYGKYSQYKLEREKASSKEQKKEGVEAEKPRKKEASKKTKLTFKEQQEYNKLEPEIEKLEAEKTSLESELNTGALDYEALNKKSQRVAELIELIDQKMQRWMELGEFS